MIHTRAQWLWSTLQLGSALTVPGIQGPGGKAGIMTFLRNFFFFFATLPATLKLLKSSSSPLVSNFGISSSFLFACLLVFSRKLNWGTNQVFCHWAKSQPPVPPGRRNAEVIPMERTIGIRDDPQLNGILLNSQFSVLFYSLYMSPFLKQSFLQLTRNCQSFPTVLLRKGSMEWKRNIS